MRSTTFAAAGALTLAMFAPALAQAATADLSVSTFHQSPANTRATDGVLLRESFDELRPKLRERADDPNIVDGTVGFTHTAPKGWSVTNDASMAGIGVEEWRGWSFTTRQFWTDAEDQMRFRFGRANDIIAVADSDEFDDRNGAPHSFATSLTSEQVKVKGLDAVELSFDSHYRGWTGQSAVVTASFDGGPAQEVVRFDSSTVTNNYDGSKINSTEKHVVAVPQGAKNVTFTWSFKADRNSWYWAIDSVAVRKATPAVQGTPTSAWVVSDIQGQPADLDHALRDLKAARPDANGLLMVGDIVATGWASQWADINKVMAANAGILPPQTIAAIGNHENYTGEPFAVTSGRFLDFAQRDKVYGEYILKGKDVDVPVLVLGQEESAPPDVPMSQEQLRWFDARLDHWTKQKKQVLVVSHFPLGDTHSASWIPWYHEHYQFNDLLTTMLGDHPNAVMLDGHTHYPAELGDWAVQRRVTGGHPDGFWAINTLAIQVEWDARGESTNSIDEVVTRDINRGLTVDAYKDRMVVTARDFGPTASPGANNTVNSEIRNVTIPNPFVK